MVISIEFGSYNDRRYSRPWISRVTAWPTGKAPTPVWGRYLGTAAGGEVEIEAEPGDVVRWGQKDNRKISGSESYWGIVQADGTVTKVTEPEARKHWRERKCETNAPSLQDDLPRTIPQPLSEEAVYVLESFNKLSPHEKIEVLAVITEGAQ